MKKFKIIRNILIIVILLLAVGYIFWMRSSKIEKSKAYKIIEQMERKDLVTMQVDYEDDNIDFKIIWGTNWDENGTIQYQVIDTNYKKEKDMPHVRTIRIDEKNPRTYFLSVDKKVCNKIEDADINWTYTLKENLMRSNYYTKGYEVVNGKLLYYEKFKDSGTKFYFDKDELVYIKNKGFDESVDGVKDALYKINISYDDQYKNFIKIPDDCEKQELDENNEWIKTTDPENY